MRPTTRAVVTLLLAGCVAAMSMALPSSEALSFPYAQAEYLLHYDVDYSQVPSWVRIRDLTLKVLVGQAQSVNVVADGQAISSSYNPLTGWITFTTAASQIDIRVQSVGAPIGDIQKAALRDDKRWAYSLTFDDGYTDVMTYGKPMLDRLGYRAGVAIIGEWLGTNLITISEGCIPSLGVGRDDAFAQGYISASQLRVLGQSGWGLFNHGFVHSSPEAMPGCVVENLSACSAAIERLIPWYRTVAYTAYQNRADLADLAATNQALLGFQLIQAGGGGATQINSVSWSTPPFRLQRYDVGAPRDGRPGVSGALYYMDETHGKAVSSPSSNYWLSLHGHHVHPNDVAGSSLDYLYFMYGPGGADEVWVAPADEVLQYLATRDFAVVRRVGSRAVSATFLPPQIRTVAFRQGWKGYTGMTDTYIDAAQPNRNYNSPGDAGALRLRSTDNNRKAALLRFDVSSIPAGSRILRATLGFYVQYHTNDGDISVSAHTLRKAWEPNEATWERASASAVWSVRGAEGTTGENRDRDYEYTDSRSVRWYKYKDDYTGLETLIDNATWYSMDITNAVREWVADPSRNRGVILRASTGSTELQIASSEYPDTALRPCLVITYTEPEVPPAALGSQTPSPTPTTTTTATATPTATPSSTANATATPSSTATQTPTQTTAPTATATPGHSATATTTPPSGPRFRLMLPAIFRNVSYSTPR